MLVPTVSNVIQVIVTPSPLDGRTPLPDELVLATLAGASGVAGVPVWTATTLMTGEMLLALGPAVPVALFTALGSSGRRTRSLDVSRRRVLGSLAGAIGAVGVAVDLDALAGDEEDEPLAPAPGAEGVDDVLRAADDRSLDVASDDLHGLVSPIGQFYNVDIAEFDPEIPAEDVWRQWRHRFEPDGTHEVVVRGVDAEGNL